MARQRVERRREGAGVRPVSCRTIRTSTVSTISRLPRPFVDSVRIFFLACILIYPLLKLEYLDNWGSIESTFISDARMLREHLPHPAWQPLWYCGTRFDYIYPPALRYGTALTSLVFVVSTARAYHLYIGVLYALGIAGVYLLAYAGSRSRAQGWLAAVLTAVLSPSLGLRRATSYVGITQINLRWVGQPTTRHARLIVIVCILVFGIVSFLVSKRRKHVAWPVFLFGSAAFVSIYVLGTYFFNFTVAGNGMRLAPELDLIVILLASYGIWTAWQRPMLRSAIVVLLCEAAFPAARYVTHAWTIFPPAGPISERCEYDIPKWMNDHLPEARAMPSGSIRFWYDTWHNDSQAYGGSGQGMLDQIIPTANWWITQGDDPKVAVTWLQALGADAVIVPDKNSQEHYHDYSHPEKFQGVLTPLYDDQKGTIVYAVPRRFPGIARVVDRSALVSFGDIRPEEELDRLTRYVSLVERGPDSQVTI